MAHLEDHPVMVVVVVAEMEMRVWMAASHHTEVGQLLEIELLLICLLILDLGDCGFLCPTDSLGISRM